MAGKLGSPTDSVAQNDAASQPAHDASSDVGKVVAALGGNDSGATQHIPSAANRRATPTARGLLLGALSALLIVGVIATLEIKARDAKSPTPADAARADTAFNNARAGNCLTWPKNTPDQVSFVLCKDDHVFEVAESVDMRTSQADCGASVRHYLGNRYDPNSRFTVGVRWPGDIGRSQPGERRLLCGLQLLGVDNQPVPFKGRVAELDQSKVWAPGTCLGIDASTNQPTDTPVDCSTPHAVEVMGTANLAESFPGPRPAEPEQDAFLRDTCTRITDAYLAPQTLHNTALTLTYHTVSAPSWSAGSRKVSCAVGTMFGNAGWAAVTGSVKTSGAPPPAPPAPPPAPPPPPAAPPKMPQPQQNAAQRPPLTPAPTATPTLTSTPSPLAAPPAAATTPTEATPAADTPPVLTIPGLPPISLPVLPPTAGM